MPWQLYSRIESKQKCRILYFLSVTSSVLSAPWNHPDDFEALTEYKRGEVEFAEGGPAEEPTFDRNVFSFIPFDYNIRVAGCILLFSQMIAFMFLWIAELYEYNYWPIGYRVQEKLDDDICPEDFKTARAVETEKSPWKMWTTPSAGETEFLEDEPMLVQRQQQARFANWSAKEHNADKKVHEVKRSRQWKQEKERKKKEKRIAKRKEEERKEREKVERQKREEIKRKEEIERLLDREDERRRIRDEERARRRKEEQEERKRLEKEEKEAKRKERIRKRKELIKVDKTQEDDVEQNPQEPMLQNPADDMQEVQTMKEMVTEMKTMKEPTSKKSELTEQELKAQEQAAAPAPSSAQAPPPPAPVPFRHPRPPQDFHEVRLREQAKDIETLDAEEHAENLRKKQERKERRRKRLEMKKKEEEE